MKYEQMCKEILQLVGGKENIASCYNCMTRLRIILNDVTLADVDGLKKVDGALGVNLVGSQLQVIIGPEAGSVCKEFCEFVGINQEEAVEDSKSAGEDATLGENQSFSLKSIPGKIIDTITNCVQPLLPIIICGSMFKMLSSILGPAVFNIIPEGSDLYILFNMMGDVVFYFLPILIGYTGAKYFKISIPLGIMMGCVLLHPTLIGLVEAGEAFSVYGIPMKLVNYSSSMIPIILSLWIMSYVEKFFQKIIPDMLKMMLVNLCTMLVMLPLTLCILAPIGTVVGESLANFIIMIPQYTGPFGVAFVCLIWTLLVITGMHMPIAMLAVATFMTEGHEDLIFIANGLKDFSVMGVALAFTLLAKNKKDRSLGISSFTASFIGGVVEPTLFGIAIPNKKYLFAILFSAGLAGLFAGFTEIGVYVLGAGSNFMGVLAYAGSTKQNLIFGIIACAIAFVSGFVFAFIANKMENKKVA